MTLKKYQQGNNQGRGENIVITWEMYMPGIQKYYFAAYELEVGYVGLK